jgi:hypothetical protein
MTTRPATPLPWRYEPKRDNSASAQQMKDEPIGGSIMSDDMHVARIWSDTDSPTENAAYLCHAANSYPRLVEVLRDLIGPAQGGYADGYPDDGEVDAAKYLLAELGESSE